MASAADKNISVRPKKGSKDEGLKKLLQKYADTKSLSMNQLCVRILSEFIKNPRPLYD